MAIRRPGGQPGSKNAAGRRSSSTVTAGRVRAQQAATARALKSGARGVTVTGTVRGVQVRAFISARPAQQGVTGVRVSRGQPTMSRGSDRRPSEYDPHPGQPKSAADRAAAARDAAWTASAPVPPVAGLYNGYERGRR